MEEDPLMLSHLNGDVIEAARADDANPRSGPRCAVAPGGRYLRVCR